MRQCDRIGCHAFENENIFRETFAGRVATIYLCGTQRDRLYNYRTTIYIVALYVTLREAARGIKRVARAG